MNWALFFTVAFNSVAIIFLCHTCWRLMKRIERLERLAVAQADWELRKRRVGAP